MQEDPEVFRSLMQAAIYARTCRQAIFLAIMKHQLVAEKQFFQTKKGEWKNHWVITKKDLDIYRANKYNREKRVVDGQKLFDIGDDRWSVLHAAKTLSAMLGRNYPIAHIYYLLRTGQLRAYKKGNGWVLKKEQVEELYLKELEKERSFLKA